MLLGWVVFHFFAKLINLKQIMALLQYVHGLRIIRSIPSIGPFCSHLGGLGSTPASASKAPPTQYRTPASIVFLQLITKSSFLGEGIPIKTTSGVVSEISLAIVSFSLSMKYPLRIPAITTFGNRLRITSFNFSSVESLAPKKYIRSLFLLASLSMASITSGVATLPLIGYPAFLRNSAGRKLSTFVISERKIASLRFLSFCASITVFASTGVQYLPFSPFDIHRFKVSMMSSFPNRLTLIFQISTHFKSRSSSFNSAMS